MMVKRVVTLLVVAVIVFAGAWGVIAQDRPPATPGNATASPSASPGASPVAIPVGTPFTLIGDVESGKSLASQCIGCHSVDGTTVVGPSWKGIFGSTEELEDGTTVVVDDAYLANSIKDPMSQIVKGYPPAMPPYSWMTDQQIADIIAYIKSLE